MNKEQIIEQIRKLENYNYGDECPLLLRVSKDQIDYLRKKLKEIEGRC